LSLATATGPHAATRRRPPFTPPARPITISTTGPQAVGRSTPTPPARTPRSPSLADESPSAVPLPLPATAPSLHPGRTSINGSSTSSAFSLPRPSYSHTAAIKGSATFPAPPRTFATTLLSLLSSPAPPPIAGTTSLRPPPPIHLCTPSQPKVGRGVESPRPSLHFPHPPTVAVHRTAGAPCRPPARSPPPPFSILNQGEEGEGHSAENPLGFLLFPPTESPSLFLSRPFQINPTPLSHTTKQPCPFTNRPLGYSS
jgi:hypothetical protein